MDLTKRQQEIFDFIKRYSAKYGYPPTVRDIGKAVGLASSSTVHAHLANLEKAGLLRRDPLAWRRCDRGLRARSRGRRAVSGEPALLEEGGLVEIDRCCGHLTLLNTPTTRPRMRTSLERMGSISVFSG